MIDINELRRKVNSTDIVDHIDLPANIRPIISELLDRLEAAEKDIALKERVIDALSSGLNAVAKERDELRAKTAEMEKQEPVAWFYVTYGEWDCYSRERPQEGAYDAGSLMALYALPGAQTQGEEK